MAREDNGYRLDYFHRPGEWLGERPFSGLAREIWDVAATCFDEVPEYQVMVGTRDAFADKVVTTARGTDGRLAGFCSAVLLPVEGVGLVLHLGLTCVRPEDRGGGLTHRLMKKLIVNYLLRCRPVGSVWVTNCAAVLSSLGNTALYFERVYPSPLPESRMTPKHLAIALAIDMHYRDAMFIAPEAWFDPLAFVFRGSVRDTVFQKEAEDHRYHHRLAFLNDYYRSILDFGNGDEVLQVGKVSLASALRYPLRMRKINKQFERSPAAYKPGIGLQESV